MNCRYHRPPLSFTEEMIQNQDYMGCIKNWRRFRIEYGYECSCPEGTVYLPPSVDPDVLEEFMRKLCGESV